ncbi:MAG: hypothetical protein ABI231_08660 [Candidatus Tumulicola sp.]
MTDEELRPYLGRRVSVGFTNGDVLSGRLVVGEEHLVHGQPYAIEILGRSPGESSSWLGLPHASAIVSIRALDDDEVTNE